MEKRYFSQNEIQTIVCLLGSKVFYEELCAESKLRHIDGVQEKLTEAVEIIEEVVHSILTQCEENQAEKLKKCNGNYKLCILPKYDPKASKDMALIEWENYEYLIYKATEDCTFCTEEKSAKEVKECRLRKVLLETGVVPTGSNCECGYTFGGRNGK